MDNSVLQWVETLVVGIRDNVHNMRLSDLEIAFDSLQCALWQMHAYMEQGPEDEQATDYPLAELTQSLRSVADILAERMNILRPTGTGCLMDSV